MAMKLKNPKKLEEIEPVQENTNPIIDGYEFREEEDDTIFYFTNNYDQDWSTQWNKVMYTFPAKRRTRMAIRGESPENVQSIRKMFAERYATWRYQQTTDFEKRNKPIEGQRPVAYSASVLQPFIDECLKPLPKAKLISEDIESNEDVKFSGSTRPLAKGIDPNVEFAKDPIPEYGEMPSN